MILKFISSFLNKGSERTALVKKNIVATFFIKGLSVIISLLYVPITLNYLNPTRYGIWMTLTSIVAWMGIFDIGLGNGLRNKLSEALALDDKEKAKKYVSTAYAMFSIIIIAVLIFFFIINNWIDWSRMLNTSESYSRELRVLVEIVVLMFSLKFILNIISTVLLADQKSAISSIFEVVGNSISLLFIWILTLLNKTSLTTFGFVAMTTPVLVYLCASIFFFRYKYAFLRPSIKYIDFSHAKDLTGLGMKFFIIQISVLIIFQTSNILIAQFFSPAEVNPYNIIYKYFSVITMFWEIIMVPFWSAFTNAWTNNDISWIKMVLHRIIIGFSILIVITFLLFIFRNYFIKFWLGDSHPIINIKLVFAVVIYVLISAWNNIFAFFLNGIGKIKLSLYFSILSAILIIPMNFLFIEFFHFGVSGVIWSINLALSVGIFIGPIQTYLILNNKAKGIWNH